MTAPQTVADVRAREAVRAFMLDHWSDWDREPPGFRNALLILLKNFAASEDVSQQETREALLTKALHRISVEPLHSLPIVTTQRMRNIADFALLGEDLA